MTNQRNEIIVVVVKILDYTRADDEITSLKIITKGDLLHGVSSEINFKENREECSRRRTICERAREEWSNLGIFFQQNGQSNQSPTALSKHTWHLYASKQRTRMRTYIMSKGRVVKYVKIFRPPNKTAQERVSHLDQIANMKMVTESWYRTFIIVAFTATQRRTKPRKKQ